MAGTHHKLLDLDLDTGHWHITTIDHARANDFVGGSALAARLFIDQCDPATDPLDPASPLFVMTGPLVGTTFPGSSRFVVCARSPLTGFWGESASGGTFGADLKKAGWDGIVIRGRAPAPTYLLIEDSDVSIQKADSLWGQDTYTTIDDLNQKHGPKPAARVLAIGPAGENLVKFAAIGNDKAHYFGRTGMGAVMGSKNLKAIVVRGSGPVPLANPDAYKKTRKATLETIKESMIGQSFHALGTAAAMDMGMMTGDVPIKNWSVGVDYEMADALGGPALEENLLKKRGFCFACPIGCKPVVEVESEKYPVPLGPGPEYETCASFGTMIMNSDLEAVAHVNTLCNRLGIDTITCGATIAFAMEAYEKGFLTTQDTDGLEMTWGNMSAVTALVEKIAQRDGFGDRAAEGSQALAASLGPEALEFAVTVKNLEPPMHDPRAYHGQGLAYMMSNRGACHLQHSVQAIEQGMVSWEDAGLEEDYPSTSSEGKAKMVVIAENIGQMANAACVCHFVHWAMGLENLLNGFNAVTGWGFDLNQFLAAGQRAWVIKRAINTMLGATIQDDRLPKRILTPLPDGGTEGTVPDEALMQKEYYRIRGLDENGRPTPDLLQEAGLGFVMDKF
jgi:aldehyde:ferredoxin oxidoreductase